MNNKLFSFVFLFLSLLLLASPFASSEKTWNFNNHTVNISDDLYVGGSIFGDGSGLTGIQGGRWNVSGMNFFPENLNYKIGIGTQTPDTKLDVIAGGANGIVLNQDTSASVNSARLFFKAAAETFTIANINGKLEFRSDATIGITSGTSRMILDGSGNLGIGTNSPDYALDVKGTGNITARFKGSIVASNGEYSQIVVDSGYADNKLNLGVLLNPTDTGYITWGNDDPNTGKGIFLTELGNVGIGTTTPSPGLRLDVSGNIGADMYCDGVGGNCKTITELSGVEGSGVGNYLTKWNYFGKLVDSIVYDNGTNVGIGMSIPIKKLDVRGTQRIDSVSTTLPTNFATLDSKAQLQLAATATSGGRGFLGINANNLYLQQMYTSGSLGNVLLQPLGGNVGIGTSSPGTKLDVVSAGWGNQFRVERTDGNPSINLVDSLNSYEADIYINNGNLELGANGTSLGSFVLQKITGNVGIGTTDPQAGMRMDVRSDGVTDGSSAITAYGYNGNNGRAIRGHGYAVGGTGNNFGVMGASDGSRAGGTNIGGHFSASGAANNYALITGAGNVGIGTASPGAKLDVAGAIAMNGENVLNDNSGMLSVGNERSSMGYYVDMYYNTLRKHSFEIAGVEEMNVSASGVFVKDTVTADKFQVGANVNTNIYEYGGYLGLQSPGNEFMFGGTTGAMHVNYRPANGGTPSSWIWENGNPGVFADFRVGDITADKFIGDGSGLTGITATTIPWSGITGVPTTVYASSVRPGPTKWYRRDDNSGYNLQHHWAGVGVGSNKWFIRGYSGDTFHAEAYVAFAGASKSCNADGTCETGNLIANGGIHSNRASANGGIWFNSNTDQNHVLWNDYYGGPTTKGAAGSGWDGMIWNAYNGLKIRTGQLGATERIAVDGPNNRINLLNSNVGIGLGDSPARLGIAQGSYAGGQNRNQAIYVGSNGGAADGQYFTAGWKDTMRSGENFPVASSSSGRAFYIEAGSAEAGGIALDENGVTVYSSGDDGNTFTVYDKDTDTVLMKVAQDDTGHTTGDTYIYQDLFVGGAVKGTSGNVVIQLG